MMFKLPRLPLRRYRHGAGRVVRGAVSASLSGMQPRRGAVVPQPAAPGPADTMPPDTAHDAWARFQSGIAAGG